MAWPHGLHEEQLLPLADGQGPIPLAKSKGEGSVQITSLYQLV